MAEDLADYLRELGVKVQYLHSEVDTLERVQILRDLRLGIYDVLVGINLLREGIDLPEVTLVAILDADKEGFLRSAWSLIQVSGRAARHVGGHVIMYADTITESMKAAIEETDRRRSIQEAYNVERGIEPRSIVKEIHDLNDRLRAVAEASSSYGSGRNLDEMSERQITELVKQLTAEMRAAAGRLEFERAAALRDEVQAIRMRVLEEDASLEVARAAERAARSGGDGDGRAAIGRPRTSRGKRGGAAGRDRRPSGATEGPLMEVTAVTVLEAGEEPTEPRSPDEGTASDWLPGIRDEHDDDGGWQAQWLDRPTWDRRVTPNVIKRTGKRPPRGARRY
jgi:superfamily II DNA/RNA helicase